MSTTDTMGNILDLIIKRMHLQVFRDLCECVVFMTVSVGKGKKKLFDSKLSQKSAKIILVLIIQCFMAHQIVLFVRFVK